MTSTLRVEPLNPESTAPLDIFICAAGYETRSRFVAHQLVPKASAYLAIGFPDQRVLAREENDHWFLEAGYKLTNTTDKSFNDLISEELNACLRATTIPVRRIAVDISCFTRKRLAIIVDVVRRLEFPDPLTVDFYYALAKFSPPPSVSVLNTHVGPILPTFAGLTTEPDRRTVAVVGLGYEQDKALGAIEHLQTEEEWLFEPASSIHEYSQALHSANQSLFDRVPPNRVVKYRVEAPLSLFNALESLLYGLSSEASPVLLPFGPKVFALCSCLVGCLNQNVSVWRVSAEHHEIPLEREPSGYIGGLSVTFLYP